MKKILLAVSALFLFGATFAQTNVVNRHNEPSVTTKRIALTGFEEGAVPSTVKPMMRNMSRSYVGVTSYDCQSNGSMPGRIGMHSDGTVSAIWTTNGSTTASRGTGYNYFDGSAWVNSSSSSPRIENVRTGWPTMTTVGNAEIVAAHDGSTALVIGVCPQKGTQNWTFTTLQGPSVSNGTSTSTCLLWPSIASSGNTIHLIACTESDEGFLYNGINTCLVYYRGTFNPSDNTIAWESPRVVGDVTPSEVNHFQGDGYAIAAKGDNVAIVAAPGMTKNPFLWKSTNNGQTFSKTVFFETAPAGDTAYRSDGCVAVAIGDDGTAHIAMGTYWCYIMSDTSSSYTWWPSVGYLLYWNETMAPITYNGSQTSADPETLAAAGYTVVERFNLDCDESLWGVSGWGIDAYPSYGVGVVSFPQLIAQNGKVYMTFCQMMEFPFVDASSEKYYRGVFATKSDNNGQSFGDYSWLSYNKDCYYVDSWELFPIDTNVGLSLNDFMDYINTEGESVYPSVAPQLVNGNIAMIWQQDYVAGSEIKESSSAMCQEESLLYYFSMNADSIGIYNNTHEVCQGLWIDHTGISNKHVSGMKVYPNPASESVNLTFSSEISENGIVSVMNLMGQTVYTQNVSVSEGYNMINIPVKQFNSGVYMVTLRTNAGLSTQKLIVK
jgi:hypothetical protein